MGYFKSSMMPNILHEILATRKKSLARQIELFESTSLDPNNSPRIPLSKNIPKNEEISIISEIKPSSPSLGTIKSNICVAELAKEMEHAGVVGLSILTEPNYFKGSFENLREARRATRIPCLMKDFIFHESQFQIAKKIGATNILLINQLGNLEKLYELALQYGLEPLIEIHDQKELEELRHLREIGHIAPLVGINNRNLNTMKIDLNTSKELIPQVKEILGENTIIVSESGVHSEEDISFLHSNGADAFLIGSSIMKSENIPKKIHQLRGIG
ncbi:MAG: indole-3-glycerol-phosphate synthase [Promethearchaeota archaeon]|nr:MAG: indole-3-glycerol-phosphate synthase [Candidatus Lokiarchaeota archaeon]